MSRYAKRDQLRRVRKYFYNDLAPRSTARHNFRAWLKSTLLLGDKWVALPTVSRSTHAAQNQGATNA